MSEWVIDNRGGICEQCEEHKQSLAFHWARSSTCSAPPLPEDLREVIRGCLLGDGSLDNPNDGPPALRIASVRYDHIEWLHDQLAMLSRGVKRAQTPHGDDIFRLRTMTHPGLGAFWTWQDTPPTTDWQLTRPIARIWYACDGSLEWPGVSDQPRVQWTITDDAKREGLERVLTDAGFEPMVWERRLALPFDEAEEWLEWLGSPTPGSEYKWATDHDRYQELRSGTRS